MEEGSHVMRPLLIPLGKCIAIRLFLKFISNIIFVLSHYELISNQKYRQTIIRTEFKYGTCTLNIEWHLITHLMSSIRFYIQILKEIWDFKRINFVDVRFSTANSLYKSNLVKSSEAFNILLVNIWIKRKL